MEDLFIKSSEENPQQQKKSSEEKSAGGGAGKQLGKGDALRNRGSWVGSRCVTCWTRNRGCARPPQQGRLEGGRLHGRFSPSVRRNQSQLEHGKLRQLELEFQFFCLVLPIMQVSSQALSLNSEANSADDRSRDVSSTNQNLWGGGVHFNRGKTGTGPTNPLQQE